MRAEVKMFEFKCDGEDCESSIVHESSLLPRKWKYHYTDNSTTQHLCPECVKKNLKKHYVEVRLWVDFSMEVKALDEDHAVEIAEELTPDTLLEKAQKGEYDDVYVDIGRMEAQRA